METLKIRQKVALLVAVPLLAVITFAALTVVTTGTEALQADRLRTLANTNVAVGQLTYSLQTERTLAVQSLVDDEGGTEDYLNHIKTTDDAITKYKEAKTELSDLPDTIATTLERIDDELEDLDSLRDRISDSKQSASAAAFAYRIVIADLLSYRDSVPQSGNVPSQVADKLRASNLSASSAEYQSIQTETVLRAIGGGELSAAAYQKVTAANTGNTEALLNFDALAPSKWHGWLEQAQGTKITDALLLEDAALRTQPGNEFEFDAEEWVENQTNRSELHQDVQLKIDEEILTEIQTLRDEQYRSTTVLLAGMLLALIVALLMAVWIGSPIVRGLRRLRDSAHHVATEGLPRAVAKLDEHTDLDNQTPEEFAKRSTPPVEVKGRDELADVAKAFNEVHREAIRVAAYQALLRLHVGGMFVRLARRGHSLAGRLTKVLDEAERNEQDPDRLERLFKLDHLVTLFGRTNDSLLVLGGVAPARGRRANETAGNVLTAAQSQIEQYTRVQLGIIDEGVSLKAAAVDDVVKLLAELLDNATQYSQHPVNVTARLLSDRLVIQISDRGMGIPPDKLEQLNARLVSRRPLELESFQTMGLTVVGRIAAQHNIEVELRAAAVGGTLAEVSLPVSIIEVNEPKAIAAAPEPAPLPSGPRKAPLFQKRSRKSREEAKSQKNEKTQKTHKSTSDVPKIHFDWTTVPVDPGHAPSTRPNTSPPETQTEEHPAVPRQRQMNVSGLKWFDDGSRAAERATAPSESSTDGDLPRRDPMARLVPGAVESPTEETSKTQSDEPIYRDPVSVSAAYVAYSKTRPGRRRK